jgi:2-oxoglutarate ferredoxin oxidoreductase subunit gamma
VTTTLAYATVWDRLQAVFDRLAARGPTPIILSSLPYFPEGEHRHTELPLLLGPPGRLVALAIGLRAARPDNPIVIVAAADSVTIGTNHLIHAARRNYGLTLLLLRSDLLSAGNERLDRSHWTTHGASADLAPAATPLEWAVALEASIVGRGSIDDADGLADLVAEAVATPGFSVIGVTAEPGMELGVLSRTPWPEFFTAYRDWAAGLPAPAPPPALAVTEPAADAPPRLEVRIAGIGGQGVKLAGTVLAEAAGLRHGLWTTEHGEYGSATRGGPSMVDVVCGSEPITYASADQPDVLVLLSAAAAGRYLASAPAHARIVADAGVLDPLPEGVLEVPITRLAREHTGKPLAAGVTALGSVAALTGVVSVDSLAATLAERLPERLLAGNLAALGAAYEITANLVKEGIA